MSDPVLLVERSDGVATLTLNRPAARNALSTALRTALVSAFRELTDDDAIDVLILTGSGVAFTAGLDLKELSEVGLSGGGTGEDPVEVDVIRAMREFPKPIIGAINGPAVTGGFEVALACDLLIASSEARFADTHARVGLLPGWGLSQKLSRFIGIGRAKELSLTGNYLSAVQAERWGLVNRVVPPDQLLPACRALAADMSSCEPVSLRAYKRVIDDGYDLPFAEALKLEIRRAVEHAKTVTPEAIAARRRDVQSRGRTQSKD
jgi:enoyl-CoA hydratase